MKRKNYSYYQRPIQLPMVRPGYILALGYVLMIAVGIKF